MFNNLELEYSQKSFHSNENKNVIISKWVEVDWVLEKHSSYGHSLLVDQVLKITPIKPGAGGHCYYGGDVDVRLQRPPIFSAAVTQWPHIFADCLCCHPKTPHFLWNVGSLMALTQRPPIFCIRLPQEATFCFNFIDKLIIFAIFNNFIFFFCKFLLLKCSLKDQT